MVSENFDIRVRPTTREPAIKNGKGIILEEVRVVVRLVVVESSVVEL